MGGFSPPVPTAPTVNSGVRTVTQIDTVTSLIRDVSSEIQFEHAEAAPLLAMTKAIRGRKVATQRKFEWQFVKDFPRELTYEAAATAAAATITITEWSRLIAGMQLMDVRTGEIFLVTATPTSSNAIPHLVPGSTIRQIGDYVRNHEAYFRGNLPSFVGKVGETEIRIALLGQGVPALFPPEGTPGFDLRVPKEWLESKLHISVAEGILQVKTVRSTAQVQEHVARYPGIPLIAPDEVVDQFANSPHRELLIRFSDIDAKDYHEIFSST